VFDRSRCSFPSDSIADDHEITQLVHDVRHSCRLGRLERERSNAEYDNRESGARDLNHNRRQQRGARSDFDSHFHDRSR